MSGRTYLETCPMCEFEHTVEDLEDEEHEELCLKCQRAWVESEEYQAMMEIAR